MHHSLTTIDSRNNSISKIIAEEKLTLFLWCYQVSSLFCALAVGSRAVFINYTGAVFTLVKTDRVVGFLLLLCQKSQTSECIFFSSSRPFSPPQVATAFSIPLRQQNPMHKTWIGDPVLPQTEYLAAPSKNHRVYVKVVHSSCCSDLRRQRNITCCSTEQAKNLDSAVTFKKEFVLVSENLYNYGLEEYEKREATVSKFYKRFYEILTVNQQESKRTISDFESQNKRVMLYFYLFDMWFLYILYKLLIVLKMEVAPLNIEKLFWIDNVVMEISTWSLMAESQSGWEWKESMEVI